MAQGIKLRAGILWENQGEPAHIVAPALRDATPALFAWPRRGAPL